MAYGLVNGKNPVAGIQENLKIVFFASKFVEIDESLQFMNSKGYSRTTCYCLVLLLERTA
jgi:hypothetical protein